MERATYDIHSTANWSTSPSLQRRAAWELACASPTIATAWITRKRATNRFRIDRATGPGHERTLVIKIQIIADRVEIAKVHNHGGSSAFQYCDTLELSNWKPINVRTAALMITITVT